MLTDEGLLGCRSEKEAEDGKYTIVNWVDDDKIDYIRKATFEEVIKYTISDMNDCDIDEHESARAIQSYMQEQNGSTKIVKIYTHDANRERMPGYRPLNERVMDYIFTRPLQSDDGSSHDDFLEMVVRLESAVGG